jgi:hypothetical protein
MISVPVVTAVQIENRLEEAGFKKTTFRTDTSTIWVHVEKQRHLTVPNPIDGFYPSWLLEQLIVHARSIGDDALVDSISGTSGWERMLATKKKVAKKSPAKGKPSQDK